jgi:hypothetical protein
MDPVIDFLRTSEWIILVLSRCIETLDHSPSFVRLARGFYLLLPALFVLS